MDRAVMTEILSVASDR